MRNFSSSMHGNINSAQNRSEKRAEHARELGHENTKMTGLLYHSDGIKKDKKGNAYSPHYGTKEQGHRAAGVVKGRYVHLGEDAIDISFEDMVEEACWKGYKQVGMKKKGDKQVPNCVPENVEENHIPVGTEIDSNKGKMKVTKQKGKDGYEVKELDESIVHSQEDVTGAKFHIKKLSSGTYDLHKQAKTGEWQKMSSHKSLESAKQMIK